MNTRLSASRRDFLQRVSATALFFTTPGLFAEELTKTPLQTEGPFYPDKLPLDTDNDLIVINNATTPAVGDVTWLSGRILDASGKPVRNATVEIWQVDGKGVYLHTRGGDRDKRDANFQGFGRFLTGSDGQYLFRTVKPVPYPGRTPHIHYAVHTKGRDKFTTQCYVKGEKRNDEDFVLKAVTDAKAKESLIVPFEPVKGSKIGELAARFDIVLGFTPEC